MFLSFYGLNEQPFGVIPDPRFLGTEHREAAASLFYGIETDRGFLSLIAKPGLGKRLCVRNYAVSQIGRTRGSGSAT